MTPQTFLELVGRRRASAILRCDDQTVASDAMSAAVRGGFSIIEFTLTIPGAYELISDFAQRPGLVVGAGTVLDPEQAHEAVRSGARYLVSPVVDEQVITAATELGVTMMAGTHTPSEMLRAHRLGSQLQKLFPAPGLGPAYVASCLGPLPFLKIVPTNGVDATNAAAWLRAGAYSLGFVAPLFDPRDLASSDYGAVEQRARQLLAIVATV